MSLTHARPACARVIVITEGTGACAPSTFHPSSDLLIYHISAHLAACQYRRGLLQTCLSDSGNDAALARGSAGNGEGAMYTRAW